MLSQKINSIFEKKNKCRDRHEIFQKSSYDLNFGFIRRSDAILLLINTKNQMKNDRIQEKRALVRVK